jgi:SAM-dependent methyltransferase
LLKKNFLKTDVTLLEPSENLISLCKDARIRKIQGSLPDRLNLETQEKFDFIFMRFVLHHLAAGSIVSSKNLARASLLELKKHLDPNGSLIISETFY